jgi:hypothetical protein
MHDPRARRHVLERAIPAIVIEAMACAPRNRRISQRSAVDEEEVDPAVVVVIEEHGTRSHRFDQLLVGARAVDVLKNDAGVARRVDEVDARLRARTRNHKYGAERRPHEAAGGSTGSVHRPDRADLTRPRT